MYKVRTPEGFVCFHGTRGVTGRFCTVRLSYRPRVDGDP